MTRTFLVAINVEDGSLLEGLAQELEDDLLDAGYDVESVKQWASPTAKAPVLGLFPPPPPQQNPLT